MRRKRSGFDTLIKVGGSVCHTPLVKSHAPHWAALARRYPLLFVAGGGLFADQVRALDRHLHLSDSAAHWMAIAAMDQSGHLLADLLPGIPPMSEFDLKSAIPNPQSAILLPYALLRQIDPLPHSWDVTSDALAAWLAGYMGVRRLVLLKDVPGVYRSRPENASPADNSGVLAELARSQLAGCGVVDPYFIEALPPQVEAWIISGHHPDRLATLLQTGQTRGTRIRSEIQV